MRRFVAFTVGAAALLAGAVALAGPRGRVVKIERTRASAQPPRFCVIMDGPDTLLCIGAPKVGDPVAFLDQRTGDQLGELRVDSVAPATRIGVCPGKEPSLFDVKGTVTTGSVDQLSRSSIVALRGISLDKRAKAMVDYDKPTEHADEQLLVAVDLDGNATADIAMYNYQCDANGTANYNGTDERQCFDTYTERGGKLVRTHQDILELCY